VGEVAHAGCMLWLWGLMAVLGMKRADRLKRAEWRRQSGLCAKCSANFVAVAIFLSFAHNAQTQPKARMICEAQTELHCTAQHQAHTRLSPSQGKTGSKTKVMCCTGNKKPSNTRQKKQLETHRTTPNTTTTDKPAPRGPARNTDMYLKEPKTMHSWSGCRHSKGSTSAQGGNYPVITGNRSDKGCAQAIGKLELWH